MHVEHVCAEGVSQCVLFMLRAISGDLQLRVTSSNYNIQTRNTRIGNVVIPERGGCTGKPTTKHCTMCNTSADSIAIQQQTRTEDEGGQEAARQQRALQQSAA